MIKVLVVFELTTTKMPLSIDEATRQYEGYVQNIQDSIFTLESFMGSEQTFSFNMPQAIGNLDQVDILKEETAVSLSKRSIISINLRCNSRLNGDLIESLKAPTVNTNRKSKQKPPHHLLRIRIQ